MAFLTASWRDLILLNYAVPDRLLEPRLPRGVELERYQGSAYVSLVAFDFLDTRVLGVRWPGYVRFPEINLRFYVRQRERRGVCFIREIVPLRLVAWLARVLYHEPYVARPISTEERRDGTTLVRTYRLDAGGGEIRAEGSTRIARPPPGSVEHFFKEHEWGFGRSPAGRALVYRVEHPVWDVYPLASATTTVDFGAVYGPEWGFLRQRAPDSAVFAVGSEIRVFAKSPVP